MKLSRISFLLLSSFLLALVFVSNINAQRTSKPKLGRGTFTGVASSIEKNGKRVTYVTIKSGVYWLQLDASSAIIVGGNLSEGFRVTVSYKNLENSEMDIGRVFTGKAVRITILKR